MLCWYIIVTGWLHPHMITWKRCRSQLGHLLQEVRIDIACLRLVRKKYGYSGNILEFSKNTFFVSNFLSIEPCRFYNIIRRSAPIFCQRSASAQGDFSKSLSAHAKVFHQIYAFIGSKKTWQNFQSKTARDEKYSTPSFTPKKFSLNVFVQKSFPHCRCSRPGPGVGGANCTYKTERYYI